MIDTAVYSLLTGNANISALVDDRIYPEIAPQDNVTPFVCFSSDGGNTDYTYDGYQSLEIDEITIDCWADTLTEAKTLADTVRTELKNIVMTTYGSILVYKITVGKPFSIFEPDAKKYRTAFDLTISYKED